MTEPLFLYFSQSRGITWERSINRSKKLRLTDENTAAEKRRCVIAKYQSISVLKYLYSSPAISSCSVARGCPFVPLPQRSNT